MVALDNRRACDEDISGFRSAILLQHGIKDDQEQAVKLAFVSSVSENAYSPEPVARALLNMLADKQEVKDYYKVYDLTLENIALERKWILKGESPDTKRTAIYVLKDFREGRLGLFILDEMS